MKHVASWKLSTTAWLKRIYINRMIYYSLDALMGGLHLAKIIKITVTCHRLNSEKGNLIKINGSLINIT